MCRSTGKNKLCLSNKFCKFSVKCVYMFTVRTRRPRPTMRPHLVYRCDDLICRNALRRSSSQSDKNNINTRSCLIVDRVRTGGKAMGLVRLSVRLSVSPCVSTQNSKNLPYHSHLTLPSLAQDHGCLLYTSDAADE